MKPQRMFAAVEGNGRIFSVHRYAQTARSDAAQCVPIDVYAKGRSVAWRWAHRHGWRIRPVIVSPEREP